MTTSHALSRLLQLASPMLPVGAYSYSQGLEWAIECGDVHDEATALNWMQQVVEIYMVDFELPILQRLFKAWQASDSEQIDYWNTFYLAGRDSSETWDETQQMGRSLLKLQQQLAEWPELFCDLAAQLSVPSFPAIYAASACDWQIDEEDMLHTYVWSWLENQASVTMKTIPLGQVAGQRMLSSVAKHIPSYVHIAQQRADDEISNFCPMLTLASCRHETQYSRLFRS